MKDNHFLQAALQAAKDGLSVFSANLLALPDFLASAVGAKATLCEIFDLDGRSITDDDKIILRDIKNILKSQKTKLKPEHRKI